MSAPWTGCTPSCRLALATLSKSHLRPQLTASLLSCPSRIHTPLFPHQHQSQSRPSSSNSRWKARQGTDIFAREAKVQGLKSRAAFKLLEIDARYHLFKARQTVVDLGYAPGSWSQVALERTKPNGRIVGIDLIPAQPPKGVSAIQGNFLAPGVQGMVKRWLVEGERARREGKEVEGEGEEEGKREERASYIEIERMAVKEEAKVEAEVEAVEQRVEKDAAAKAKELRLVDVVLSDMMMNTSGIPFKDHVGSMDLCRAALSFASDTLKTGGHFVCKFYQGAEDKAFEKLLKKMFAKVHREKPESSRSESREAFFVALRRKGGVTMEDAESS